MTATKPPKKYAEGTRVPVNRSRDQIEHELGRHGATAFAYIKNADRSAIAFELGGRHIVISVPMPTPEAAVEEATRAARARRKGPPGNAAEALEYAAQQRWRALLLLVKAKLEAVASGIVTLEEEFLANTVMPNGQTMGQWALPQVEQAYRTGRMPPMLPGTGES